MPTPRELFDLYVALADVIEGSHRPQQRERFLALAAAAANDAGDAQSAEACRRAIIDANPAHTFRRFDHTDDAFQSVEIAEYIQALKRQYPFEKAEFLLQKYQRTSSNTTDRRRKNARPSRRKSQRTEKMSTNSAQAGVPQSAGDGSEESTKIALQAGLVWLQEFAKPPKGYLSPSTGWLIALTCFLAGAIFTMLCLMIIH